MDDGAPSVTPSGPASYWDWQRRLEKVFLRPRSTPEPFAMFLDEDEAARLWPSDPDPAEALASVVSRRLDWASRSAVFRPLDLEASTWQRGNRESPPPTLPLLAVTVLAACRMHRDAEASSTAYFLRLAQVLRPGVSSPHLDELRWQLSAGFGPVAQMWRGLHDWVSARQTTLGASTIRDHPRLTRIGYALSQTLINRSDRMRLTSFFAALDLLNRGVPEPGVLLRYLSIWASRPRGLSQQFCQALDDEHSKGMLEEHLHRLAASWDGNVLAYDGRRRLELRFALDLEEFAARWAIPVVDGVDADALTFDDGSTVRISKPDYGSLYSLEGTLPPVSQGLARGLRAVGERCAAATEPRPVIALRENVSAGAWLSVASMEPFAEHLLVIEPRLREELERALSVAAEQGWKLVPQRSPHLLLHGKLIYRRVRLSDPSAFERAVKALSPALVQGLRPDPGPRPRLDGGLPLARKLGRAHYLAGGEPDLILPVGPEPRHVDASLDGVTQSPPFQATGFPIELRRLGPFKPGRHELVVDGESLVFYLLEGLEPQPPTGSQDLAWRASEGYQVLAGGCPENADIRGAAVPGRGIEPLMLRRGAEAWLVDRYGHATRATEPQPAASLLARDLPAPYYVTIDPGPECVWLVEIRNGLPQAPVCLRWQEPHFTKLDEASAVLWRRLDKTGTGGDKLLELYLKAWRGRPA